MSDEVLAVPENEREPEWANDTDSASIPEPETISEMFNPPENDEQELLADETEKAEVTDNPAPTEGEDQTHEQVPNLPDGETVPENDDKAREAIEEGVPATTEDVEAAAAEVQNMPEEEAEPETKETEEEDVPDLSGGDEPAVAEVQNMSEEEAEPQTEEAKEEGIPAPPGDDEQAATEVQNMSEEEAEPEEKKEEEESIPATTDDVILVAAEVQDMSEEEAEREEQNAEEMVVRTTPIDGKPSAEVVQNMSEEEAEREEKKAEEMVVRTTPIDGKPSAEVVQNMSEEEAEFEEKKAEEVIVPPTPVDGKPSAEVVQQERHNMSEKEPEPQKKGTEEVQVTQPLRDESTTEHELVPVEESVQILNKDGSSSNTIDNKTSMEGELDHQYKCTSSQSEYSSEDSAFGSECMLEISAEEDEILTEFSIPSETDSHLSDSADSSKRKQKRKKSAKTKIIYCGHPSKEYQEVQSATAELVSSVNDLKGSPKKGKTSKKVSVDQWEENNTVSPTLNDNVVLPDKDIPQVTSTEDLNKFLDETSAKVKEKIKSPSESVSKEVQPSSSELSWCFYKHGEYIQLNDERVIASRCQGVLKSMVVSEMSMDICRRYKIEIESVQKDSNENMAVGVTWTDPKTKGNDVIKKICWASQLTDSLIINWSEITLRKGPKKKRTFGSGYGKALGSIDKGSTVEIEIDSQNCLHLYIDGKEGEDEGVIRRLRFISPCWAVFDVRGRCKRIRIEP